MVIIRCRRLGALGLATHKVVASDIKQANLIVLRNKLEIVPHLDFVDSKLVVLTK